MKINGINNCKIINMYSNYKKEIDTTKNNIAKDSLQISSVGKGLSSYALDDNFENSAEKIERLKEAVSNGTYNVDSKQIASKMLQIVKGEKF